MKSRVPLAGYIALILLYWFLLPTLLLTFGAPESSIQISASKVFLSKVFFDAGITIFLFMSLIFSRIFFIGSDLENLLITGVGRWRLTSGIFLFLVIFTTPIILLFARVLILFLVSASVPGAVLGLGTLLLYVIFIMLAMLSLVLGSDRTLLAIGLISVLNFTNLVGNPISMGNLDSTRFFFGSVAFAGVFLGVLAILLFSVSRKGYVPYMFVRKRRRELVTKPMNFTGTVPEKTSFRLGFSLTFTTFVNNMSARGARYTRISTKRALILLISFNTVLALLLIYLFSTPIGSTNGTTGDATVIYACIFTWVILWNLIVLSLSQERIWLLGSTIGGIRFIQNHVLSKSAVFTVLTLPTLIPFIGMAVMGHPLFLKLGFIFCVTLVTLSFPASIIGLYIAAFMLPEQYVRSELPVAGVLSLFIISIPMLYVMSAAIVTYLYLPFLFGSIAGMYGIAIFLLSRREFHWRAFRSLVFRRFV